MTQPVDLLSRFNERLGLPLIAAPMFLVSGVELVVAACRNGVIGSFPTVNCRSPEQLDQWLGEIEVSTAKSATLQMDSVPSQDSLVPQGTQVVSMFETNSIALRTERFISWQLARAGAVSAISGVDYSST